MLKLYSNLANELISLRRNNATSISGNMTGAGYYINIYRTDIYIMG